MEDDISQKVSSARQAFDLVERRRTEGQELDRKAQESSMKFEGLLKEQTALLQEANQRAALMEEKAEESERVARAAKRHAAWSNVIAIIALAFSVFLYLAGR